MSPVTAAKENQNLFDLFHGQVRQLGVRKPPPKTTKQSPLGHHSLSHNYNNKSNCYSLQNSAAKGVKRDTSNDRSPPAQQSSYAQLAKCRYPASKRYSVRPPSNQRHSAGTSPSSMLTPPADLVAKTFDHA